MRLHLRLLFLIPGVTVGFFVRWILFLPDGKVSLSFCLVRLLQGSWLDPVFLAFFFGSTTGGCIAGVRAVSGYSGMVEVGGLEAKFKALTVVAVNRRSLAAYLC